MRTICMLVVLALPAAGLAQPGLSTTTTPSPPRPATVERKDPSVAVLLSLGVTAGGAITLIAGMSNNSGTASLIGLGAMYLGPSTGLWYAGEVGARGLAARAVGGAALFYGFVQIISSECDDEPDSDCSSAGDAGAWLFFGGAGLWIGSTIADVILAKRAADRWNRRHDVTVAPTAFTSGGRQVPGLVLSARF